MSSWKRQRQKDRLFTSCPTISARNLASDFSRPLLRIIRRVNLDNTLATRLEARFQCHAGISFILSLVYHCPLVFHLSSTPLHFKSLLRDEHKQQVVDLWIVEDRGFGLWPKINWSIDSSSIGLQNPLYTNYKHLQLQDQPFPANSYPAQCLTSIDLTLPLLLIKKKGDSDPCPLSYQRAFTPSLSTANMIRFVHYYNIWYASFRACTSNRLHDEPALLV